MPLFRSDKRLLHFAHIPKCGGTAIELYLLRSGVKTAFYDPHYFKKPAEVKWNISSPQHIDSESLSRIVPASFIDSGFAVIRNPVDRFLSAFKQYQKSGTFSDAIDINEFVQFELDTISKTVGLLDNHFLPQKNFFLVDLEYRLFRLEDGLDNVKNFIDFNFDLDNNFISLPKLNTSSHSLSILSLSNSSLEKLEKIYKCDYESFSY